MAIGNCYLEFLQMCSLISLVLDNHVDNNLKEILLFVYYGVLWCSGKASDSRSRGTGFDPH